MCSYLWDTTLVSVPDVSPGFMRCVRLVRAARRDSPEAVRRLADRGWIGLGDGGVSTSTGSAADSCALLGRGAVERAHERAAGCAFGAALGGSMGAAGSSLASGGIYDRSQAMLPAGLRAGASF